MTGVEQAGGGNDIFWGWIDSSGRLGLTKGDGNKVQTSSAISDSNWHHIVLTRNSSSGQLEVYVDGNFVARVTGTTGDVTTGFSSIGRIEDTGGTPEYFAGQLDELLVFDQAISADQVQLIYNNQSAGNHWDG
ncbi:LamG domain-containing protein, partial [Ancylomarina sp. 16SWW S1-10-2]|nr:LamG domain-containing protein [Ancylomarina sp. 16SWW S1-10-2]